MALTHAVCNKLEAGMALIEGFVMRNGAMLAPTCLDEGRKSRFPLGAQSLDAGWAWPAAAAARPALALLLAPLYPSSISESPSA